MRLGVKKKLKKTALDAMMKSPSFEIISNYIQIQQIYESELRKSKQN